MTQEQINNLVETEFSEENAHPEVLQKIKIDDDVEVSIYELMKSAYKSGLKRNLKEEVAEQNTFSRSPKFECDEYSCSYYVVIHLYSAFPDLCIYDGKVLVSAYSGEYVDSKNIIGAVKLNIPNDALDDLVTLRTARRHDVMLHEIVTEKYFADGEF